MSDLPPVQDLGSFVLPANFRGRSAIVVQLWWLVQAALFRPSPQVMYGLRRGLLRLFGAHVGKNVLIRSSAKVTYPWKIRIGDYAWIGDDVVLYSLGSISIGKNAVVSQKSYLCAATHDYRRPNFNIIDAAIVVEEEAWIATDVYVGPGVTVGRGTVVGARSSVFTSLPPMSICVGSPARYIRSRI